ncbi:DUF485 domain-containing protein [Thermomonospora umbrina]|uniref:Uncharacterized membrane protein (DUF485 family) n=1 Tax=Thermomonospora umbrina TaxID=111806 RepID=A0A3D9SQH2_9ACTN|nr:DUF485 domain-containing protein [Thermomonospora umbrina]REE94834.1 uncharacterized membrane protein (DUF485 family) [Thermomonospora umbrina]
MLAEPGPAEDEGTSGTRHSSGGRYTTLAGDRRFRLLKRRHARATTTIAVVFLGWYLTYVALSAFARDLMARSVTGAVNVALVLGLLQFASTFLLAALYAVYARRALDPLAREIRDEVEDRPDEHARHAPTAPAGLAHGEPSSSADPYDPPRLSVRHRPLARNTTSERFDEQAPSGRPEPSARTTERERVEWPVERSEADRWAASAWWAASIPEPRPASDPSLWAEPRYEAERRDSEAADQDRAAPRRRRESASGLHRDENSGAWTDLGPTPPRDVAADHGFPDPGPRRGDHTPRHGRTPRHGYVPPPRQPEDHLSFNAPRPAVNGPPQPFPAASPRAEGAPQGRDAARFPRNGAVPRPENAVQSAADAAREAGGHGPEMTRPSAGSAYGTANGIDDASRSMDPGPRILRRPDRGTTR